jgi:hypothetical protein
VITVLVDDVRSFRDGRECMIARTSASAVRLLRSLAPQRIDELWLDHDLVGDDTIWPVVELLITRPLEVGAVVVHAARSGPAMRVVAALRAAGYAVRRDYDLRIWTHEMSDPTGTIVGRGGST